MTREEKIEAYSMLLDGFTYQEIADRFQVSKQRIGQIFNMRESRYSKIIYPGIRSWMIENNVTVQELNRRMRPEKRTKGNNGLFEKLRGEREITPEEIERLLRVTGLTFEEAFGRKERGQKGDRND